MPTRANLLVSGLDDLLSSKRLVVAEQRGPTIAGDVRTQTRRRSRTTVGAELPSASAGVRALKPFLPTWVSHPKVIRSTERTMTAAMNPTIAVGQHGWSRICINGHEAKRH